MYEHTSKHFDCDDPNAKVFLQITPADFFVPVPNKINVNYTMFEMLDVPESYKEPLRTADHVLVPCKYCQDLFKPYTKRLPFIINEGIESADFPYYQRKEPDYSKGGRFRILWSGARNPRKGYQYATALAKIIQDIPEVEIYIKTHAELQSKEDIFKEIEKYQQENGRYFDIDKYMDTFLSTQEV
jgi:hypothetical protein